MATWAWTTTGVLLELPERSVPAGPKSPIVDVTLTGEKARTAAPKATTTAHARIAAASALEAWHRSWRVGRLDSVPGRGSVGGA